MWRESAGGDRRGSRVRWSLNMAVLDTAVFGASTGENRWRWTAACRLL